MSDNIYKRVVNHVTKLFEDYPHPNLLYHNLAHTKKVVEHAHEIEANYQISDNDKLVLHVATWFHDTGHLFADLSKHEEKSVELMREFMQNETVDEALIKDIEGCILVTRLPHEPKNLLQEIICDADTYHFGTKEFKKTNKLVKQEFILRNYTTVTLDWNRNTLELLESHKFFTPYCKVMLEEGKRQNILRIKQKLLKTTGGNNSSILFSNDMNDAKLAKQKNTLIARGIQTMLRLASQNHLDLSEMADRKANILISVNALIISLILSVLVRRLEVDTYLTVPAIVFLVSSLATIIVAILATRPKITEGRFTKEDVISKKTNLLFFGNFYQSTFEEYEWAMSILMKDQDYLYSVLIKDVHQLGVVLARKYKLVRLAYNMFMVGLTVSVITFSIAALLNYSHAIPSNVIMDATGSPL
jgi:predicted metal-dependent HD superfamily phosphohydrolase